MKICTAKIKIQKKFVVRKLKIILVSKKLINVRENRSEFKFLIQIFENIFFFNSEKKSFYKIPVMFN